MSSWAQVPEQRLATIAAAGRAAVPFTSGLLVGIGEGRRARLRDLRLLLDLHRRHGHLQVSPVGRPGLVNLNLAVELLDFAPQGAALAALGCVVSLSHYCCKCWCVMILQVVLTQVFWVPRNLSYRTSEQSAGRPWQVRAAPGGQHLAKTRQSEHVSCL